MGQGKEAKQTHGDSMNATDTKTCTDCGSPLMSVGSSHLTRHARIAGVGSIRLNLVSYRCTDHLNCDGGIEISEHANSRHSAILAGHIFTPEGKHLGQAS